MKYNFEKLEVWRLGMELVNEVLGAFDHFYSDAQRIRDYPNGQMINNDGRNARENAFFNGSKRYGICLTIQRKLPFSQKPLQIKIQRYHLCINIYTFLRQFDLYVINFTFV